MMNLPREFHFRGSGFPDEEARQRQAPDRTLAATATQPVCVPLRRNSPSAPHIAFTLAFHPSQRLFHRLALIVSQAHFRQDGLRVDLLGDLRRRRRRGDRQGLMIVRIWIVEQRTLWRSLLG